VLTIARKVAVTTTASRIAVLSLGALGALSELRLLLSDERVEYKVRKLAAAEFGAHGPKTDTLKLFFAWHLPKRVRIWLLFGLLLPELLWA
jgi:hypothetical protein